MTMMVRAITASCLLLTGCATYRDVGYAPRPVEVDVAGGPNGEGRDVRVLVTIIGVRAGSAREHPDSVEAKMRIENRGGEIASVSGLELRAADLTAFEEPEVDAPETLNVPPGGSSEATVYFRVPDKSDSHKPDMSGLNLRWNTKIGPREFTRTVTFTRTPRVYYREYGPWFVQHDS